MTTTTRQPKTLVVVRVPHMFVVDHDERGLRTPAILRGTRTHFYMDRHHDAMADLIDDARFYAEGNVDGCAGLVASARALLRAIEEQDNPTGELRARTCAYCGKSRGVTYHAIDVQGAMRSVPTHLRCVRPFIASVKGVAR